MLINENTWVRIWAYPKEGYLFKQWNQRSSIVSEKINPMNIKVKELINFDTKLSAIFEKMTDIEELETPPNNEIWYTTSNENIINNINNNNSGATSHLGYFPKSNDGELTILTQTYNNGKGIIKFNKTITSIPDNMFETNNYITAISLPSSITAIGTESFVACKNLKYVKLSNSRIESIGSYAFSSNSSLEKINLSYTGFIDDRAFSGCTSLEKVLLNSIQALGEMAFSSCENLKIIDIGENLCSIDLQCFYGIPTLNKIIIRNDCSIRTPYIGGSFLSPKRPIFVPGNSIDTYKNMENLTDYKNYIYAIEDLDDNENSSIESNSGNGFSESNSGNGISLLPPNNQIWYTTNNNSLITINIPAFQDNEWSYWHNRSVNIVSHTYTDGKGIIELDVPILEIPYDFFYNNSNLVSVILPECVERIDKAAFSSCTSLETVYLPNSLTDIYSSAFNGCVNLNLNIPSSVNWIGPKDGDYSDERLDRTSDSFDEMWFNFFYKVFGNVLHIEYHGTTINGNGAPWGALSMN